MGATTITCPDCGLAVTVVRDATGTTFTYDVNEWQRLCKRPELDDPAWCLIQRDGMSSKKQD